MRKYAEDFKVMNKKAIGYFGCRYALYLAERDPEAFQRLMSREDRGAILFEIHAVCQEMMTNLMDALGGPGRVLNRHKFRNNIEYHRYNMIVLEVKGFVFRTACMLLEHAEWMSK